MNVKCQKEVGPVAKRKAMHVQMTVTMTASKSSLWEDKE